MWIAIESGGTVGSSTGSALREWFLACRFAHALGLLLVLLRLLKVRRLRKKAGLLASYSTLPRRGRWSIPIASTGHREGPVS